MRKLFTRASMFMLASFTIAFTNSLYGQEEDDITIPEPSEI